MVRVLKAGSIFGEVALLVNQLRTATVGTLNYCTCASLHKHHFIEMCSRFPETVNKMKLRLLRYQDRRKRFLKKLIKNVDYLSNT